MRPSLSTRWKLTKISKPGTLKSQRSSEKNLLTSGNTWCEIWRVFVFATLSPSFLPESRDGKGLMDQVKTQRKTLKFIPLASRAAVRLLRDISYQINLWTKFQRRRWMHVFVVLGLGHTCSRRSQTGNTGKLNSWVDKTLCKHATRWRGMREILSTFCNCRRGHLDRRRILKTLISGGR